MTAQLAPVPVFKAFNNDGTPLAGGLLHTYAAGTSTPQATYIDSTQSTPNLNPVVLNARGEAFVWLNPALIYKFILTDSLGNTIWTEDNIPGGIYLTQQSIGQILYPQTAAELAANVMPVNYFYPPFMVDRYATNSLPGTTDMTGAWNNAITAASQAGGVVTCLQATYRISNTLTIAGPVSIDGGNSFASDTTGSAIIYSAVNLPILRYNVGSRFVRLDNINIQGVAAIGASQDGVQIGYNAGAGAHGIRMRNVNIFNCGNYGLNVINSISGTYESLYISGCADGIVINNSGGGAVGANRWYNIAITTSVSVGLSFTATGGGIDSWYGVTSEVNNYGIVFATGVIGQKLSGVHTEDNAIQSIWFQSGSNKNRVDCETTGSSEPLPLNSGGAQNAWTGGSVVSSVSQNLINSKLIQRVYTPATAQVTAAALTAMSVSGAPTSSEGLQVLSQAIVARNTGTLATVRAWGVSTIGTTGTMIVALFGPGGSTAVEAIEIPVTGGVYWSWSFEYQVALGTEGGTSTFAVNIGSTTASDSVTAFGRFGGVIAQGGISIEECLPSSG